MVDQNFVGILKGIRGAVYFTSEDAAHRWTLDDVHGFLEGIAPELRSSIERNDHELEIWKETAFRAEQAGDAELDDRIEAAWRDGWESGHGGLGDIEDEWSESKTRRILDGEELRADGSPAGGRRADIKDERPIPEGLDRALKWLLDTQNIVAPFSTWESWLNMVAELCSRGRGLVDAMEDAEDQLQNDQHESGSDGDA